METQAQTRSCKSSCLYVSSILIFLYLFHIHIAYKLILGNEPIRIKRTPRLPLRFRHDGTFKILQVADMHFGDGLMTRCRDVLPAEFKYCSDLNTTRFLERVIRAEDPDFIAFTGDNIFGPSSTDAAESLFRAFRPAIESGLPWAAVLGNHDQESTMTREELMSFISLMDYSISQTYPSAKESFIHERGSMITNIDGFGNYNIEVHGAANSHLANSSVVNLFFLDSGDREVVNGIRTYGWIKESQLKWIQGLASRFQDQKQALDKIPALVFFHIPIPEIRQLYKQQVVGHFTENVACSTVNSGVLQTFVSMGDVKAVFIGHDHHNDFCGNLNGIWFCYGGGIGYHGYGKAGWPRRARVISAQLEKGEKAWAGVKTIKTWKRLDDIKLSKIDDQILWEMQSRR